MGDAGFFAFKISYMFSFLGLRFGFLAFPLENKRVDIISSYRLSRSE